ncbi:MAG: hypothetical protein ACKVT2_04095 [Saprospiraceae bacterium]
MNNLLCFFPLLGLLTLGSCTNAPAVPKPVSAENTENGSKSAKPDPNDLLHTLEGRWQNEQDSSYILEIADTQMQHFKNGQLSYQSMLEIDGACESPVCKPDGVDTSDGWCFTEMTIDQGKYAAKCNFVTVCDPARLQYQSLSGGGTVLSFKKIQ